MRNRTTRNVKPTASRVPTLTLNAAGPCKIIAQKCARPLVPAIDYNENERVVGCDQSCAIVPAHARPCQAGHVAVHKVLSSRFIYWLIMTQRDSPARARNQIGPVIPSNNRCRVE